MTDTTTKNRPTHTIYKVTGEGEQTRFVKVGVAFPHKDRKGLQLIFDGIPVEVPHGLHHLRQLRFNLRARLLRHDSYEAWHASALRTEPSIKLRCHSSKQSNDQMRMLWSLSPATCSRTMRCTVSGRK